MMVTKKCLRCKGKIRFCQKDANHATGRVDCTFRIDLLSKSRCTFILTLFSTITAALLQSNSHDYTVIIEGHPDNVAPVSYVCLLVFDIVFIRLTKVISSFVN